MMVKILDPSVQAEKRLRPFPPLKAKLLSLLTSCGTVRLFNQIVAARRGNHLLVIDVDQPWDFPDRGTVAPQLIGVNDLWNVVFTK